MNATGRTVRWGRRIALALVATGAVGVAPALGGPVTWETASWNQMVAATPGGWFTSTDMGNTVIGKADVAYPTQAFLEAGYCDPFGANTQLVGMGITRTRWHAVTDDMNGSVTVYTPQRKYLGVEGGQASTHTTQRFLKNQVVDGINLELQPRVSVIDTYRFPGGQCVASRVAVRGNDDRIVDTGGFVPHITQRLNRVLVEDLQGPAVANVVAPTDWITGDSVTVSWDSSDNAYKRGTTGLRVRGAGSADVGNAANGRSAVSAGLGALADGAQEVCAYRAAPLWPEASRCVAIRLDRTDPSMPPLTVTPDVAGFTNTAITVTTAPAQDGAGSGWSHNQIRIDGGSWQDTVGVNTITADGEHTVQARAVDHAGRTSAATAVRTVRVDRTAPIISNVQTDGAAGTLTWSMVDAIGLGTCRVKVTLAGPGTNGAVVIAADQPASVFNPAAAVVVLPVGAMPNGQYNVQLTVCDSAGNESTTATTLGWTGNPDGVLTGSWARFIPMNLASPNELNRRQVAGIAVPLLRRTVGHGFTITGRLQRPDGSAFSDAALEIRDSLGRYAGGFRTNTDGAFTVTARASVGGGWTLNTVGSRVLQPVAWLEVRPTLTTRAKMNHARRTLVVRGRMNPGVGVSGKAVSLQWFDSLTRKWRPVMDGRVTSTGTFRLAYRFSRPGRYTVKVRVVVPRDAGWPYLTGTSRTMTVRVR